MKRLASILSNQYGMEHGDIFNIVKENVQNSEDNRAKLPVIAKYTKYLKLQAAIFQQKTLLHWFKEAYTNSK